MRSSVVALAAAALFVPSAAAQTQNLVFITNAPLTKTAFPGQAGNIGLGDTGSSRKVVVFDINDDGIDDVYFLNHAGRSEGLLNDGAGVFSRDLVVDPLYHATMGVGAKGVAVGDTDGDGDLDVYIATGPLAGVQTANLWLANKSVAGVTVFKDVSASQPLHNDHSYDAAFIDLAGQQHLLVANRGMEGAAVQRGANRLSINADGLGHFADLPAVDGTFNSDHPDEIFNSRDLVVADLDGDGLADVFVANAGAGGEPNQAFRQAGGALVGDGVAAFLAAPGDSYGAAVADFDADGLPDLVVANRASSTAGQANFLFRNASTAGDLEFQPIFGSAATATVTPSYDVAIGDLDEDGDLDLVVANNEATNEVFMNNQVERGVAAAAFFAQDPANLFTRIVDGRIQGSVGKTRSVAIAEFADYGPNANHQGAEVILANTHAVSNEFFRGMGKQFFDVGGGTEGHVRPRLDGAGFFSPFSGGALVLSGGETSLGLSVILLDVVPSAIPWAGGTLCINPASGTAVASPLFVLDGSGSAALVIPARQIPASMSGLLVYAQGLTRDEGLPWKRGLTNAISIVIQ